MTEDLETRIRELAPMSETARALLACVSQDHSLADLVAIIERDGPLTMRVLALTNSPWYAAAGGIDTVSRAAAYLGERAIVTLAMRSGCGDLFFRKLSGYRSSAGSLWSSGLRGAIAARHLARRSPRPIDVGVAYTGAILRDIGKVVASDLLAEQGADAALERIASGESRDFCGAEQDILGSDHCELGGRICEHFELPEILREVARHHHQPTGASEPAWPVVACVHIADVLAMMVGAEPSADAMAYRLDREAVEYLSLPDGVLDDVICETSGEFAQIAEELGDSEA